MYSIPLPENDFRVFLGSFVLQIKANPYQYLSNVRPATNTPFQVWLKFHSRKSPVVG